MKEGLFGLRGEVKVSRKSWAILLSVDLIYLLTDGKIIVGGRPWHEY